MKAEQSNTSVKFGDRVIMKLYRRVEPGLNPELEIGRTLAVRNFHHSPSLVGALEYHHATNEPITLAIAQTFIPTKGMHGNIRCPNSAAISTRSPRLDPKQIFSESASIEARKRPSTTADHFLVFIDAARLLGCRTGELHMALGKPAAIRPLPRNLVLPMYNPAFKRCNVRHSRTDITAQSFVCALRSDQEQAKRVLGQEPAILDRLGSLNRAPLTAMRIRCHGDYHFGQVLYTGKDFVIIDYEGEPARPLAERRAKHIPIVDLAGMIRSFHYAAHAALRQRDAHQPIERAMQSLIILGRTVVSLRPHGISPRLSRHCRQGAVLTAVSTRIPSPPGRASARQSRSTNSPMN